MKISEFAKITGIKRANLIFYDKIGLLSPEHRGENDYRYYMHHQLGSAYLISDLRGIGVSIEDIKQYADKRTPEKMIQLFSEKEKDIEKEIAKLRKIQGAMQLYVELVQEAIEDDIEDIVIKELPEKEIFTGPLLDTETARNYNKAGFDFYNFISKQNMGLHYPFGLIVSKGSLLQNDYTNIMQCYFSVPNQGNGIRPAGRYVIGYMYGSYEQASPLYSKLLRYIKANNLVICGNAYEEYPFNEITTENDKEYLIRIMIEIK